MSVIHNPASRIVILGGPNGAGKSTCAGRLLRGTFGVDQFVNADTIAQGLSAFAPEKAAFAAGRIMKARLAELAAARANFAFETTLASRSFAPWLRDLADTGYLVHLFYLWLPSPEAAIARVAERVRRGGHHVPEEIVRRRYLAGLRNFFELYQPLADTWQVVDNSIREQFVRIAEGTGTEIKDVISPETWQLICNAAGL